jgi:hypothetical protein
MIEILKEMFVAHPYWFIVLIAIPFGCIYGIIDSITRIWRREESIENEKTEQEFWKDGNN